MRILILGVSAIALSGCSWLGLGSNNDYKSYNHNANYGNYNYQPKATNGCNTGKCLSRWNLEAALGPTINIGGNAITGDRTNAGTPANINNISFKQAYKPGVRGEIGGSYALSPNRKITGNVHYEQADSEGTLDWGTIGGQNLTGALSDYETYGAEIGLRQYFAPRRGPLIGNIRPYVEGKLGATHLNDINIEGAQLGGAAFSATDVPFYRSGWVGSAAGLVGVETPIARHATIALESGIRYTQGPRSANGLEGTPLAGTNNGGSRTSIPVMLRGRYRF